MFKRMKDPFGQLQIWVPLYYRKCPFLSVSVFYTEILIKDAIFTSPETGQAFYIAKKSYQRSSHLQGKHSGPGDRTHDIPLCSQAL